MRVRGRRSRTLRKPSSGFGAEVAAKVVAGSEVVAEAELLSTVLERGWLERRAGTRALVLTSAGRDALHESLGITF